MKRLVIGILLVLTALGCGGEESPESTRGPSGLEADPWTPMSDEMMATQIARARALAEASDRRVLLEFVADWCEDCREVVRLSNEEPARSVIEQGYVVVYVEVGRFDRHRALLTEHRIDRIATLVVLDAETGSRVGRTTLEPITGGQRGLTSAALADWLRAPTPG